MAKRKRTENADSSRTKSHPSNPFHKFGYHRNEEEQRSSKEVNYDKRESKDPVFPSFLSFMDLSKQKSNPETKIKMNRVVKELVSYLPAMTSDDEIVTESNQLEASILSATDVVTLLLPWSIKTLLRSSPSCSEDMKDDNATTQWQTLKTCLQFVVRQNQQTKVSTEGTIKVSDILTLGTLHKLVPLTINTALQNRSSQATAATCYCILVDHYYMPQFDSICDSMLFELDRNLGKHGLDEVRFHAMVTSTLRLLHRRLEKANPKKSFQKLITHEVFCFLTKIHRRSGDGWQVDARPVIEDLLLHGLFHLEHHMDGFRSIDLSVTSSAQNENENVDGDKKTKAFHCYQEGLLPMISLGLSPTRSKSEEEVAAFVGILPILLKCFIRQTLVLRDQLNEKATSKKKGTDSLKIVQLQFRFFSVLSSYLIQRLETRSKDVETADQAVVYKALEQNLRQLLAHDVYLPTMDDKKEVHFKFLASLGSMLVKKFKVGNSGKRRMESDEWKNALGCLDILVQLNHLVLHDVLPEVIANCVTNTNVSDEEELHTDASSFVITLIATYKKLRQLDYFVSSFVDAVDLLGNDKRAEYVQGLNLVMCDAKVESTFADAVFSSPVNQVKETFARLNDWIVHHALKLSSTQESISTVVSLLVLILQNVRIEMNTAREIYPLCEAVIKGAVKSVIVLNSMGPQSRNGLKLFGNAVALLNKCEFWIDRTSDKATRCEIPQELYELLDDAAQGAKIEKAVVKELQFLACQYVQRLHSQIQEMQQVMFASDEAQFSNKNHVATAQKLAQFALKLSSSEVLDTPQQAAGLRTLAESVSSWAPYVQKEDMMVFLASLFFCHILHDISNFDDIIHSQLLGNSEFFEARHVTESLGCALLSCTASLTRDALQPNFKLKSFNSKYLTCPISHSSWTRSTANELNSILTTSGTRILVHSEKGKVHLEAISKCVGMMKRLPASIWAEMNSCIDALDLVLRLDLVYRSICDTNGDLQGTAVHIIADLREISSQILQSISHISPGTSVGQVCTLRYYLQCVASSTQELMAQTEDHRDSYVKLLNSIKRSFGAIAKSAMLQPGALKELSEALESIISASDSSNDRHTELCITVLSWAIVRGVSSVRNHLPADSLAHLKTMVLSIFRMARKDFLPNALDDHSINATLRKESTQIVGELLQFDPKLISGDTVATEEKTSFVNSVLTTATTALHSNNEQEGLDYLIGCLALAKPCRSSRLELAKWITQVETTTNHVLETAFSELVSDLDVGSLQDLLTNLTSFAVGGETVPFRLRLIHLVVVKLAPTSNLRVVAEYSPRFLSLALQCMVKSTPSDCFDKTVHCAVSLIIDMASNRDVISLRESDIALVLCHISSAINVLDARSEDAQAVTTSVYSSCCSILSFLLQRFPKQLHSCVALMSGLLVALLQQALYGTFTRQDAKLRCQKYTRVCELLQSHGDVYKKHVLPVLLEYVKAMRGKLDPARKDDIMPAIFCLLDILQQYENSQLNCMLDDMGRALLRSVHANYQRAHVYKGQ